MALENFPSLIFFSSHYSILFIISRFGPQNPSCLLYHSSTPKTPSVSPLKDGTITAPHNGKLKISPFVLSFPHPHFSHSTQDPSTTPLPKAPIDSIPPIEVASHLESPQTYEHLSLTPSITQTLWHRYLKTSHDFDSIVSVELLNNALMHINETDVEDAEGGDDGWEGCSTALGMNIK